MSLETTLKATKKHKKMKKLTIIYNIKDENGTIESTGEMVLELSSTQNEILEFETTIERTTKFEHVGTRPRDRE